MLFIDIKFYKTTFTNLRTGKSIAIKDIYIFDKSDVLRAINYKIYTNQKYLLDRIAFNKDFYENIFDFLSIESIVLLRDRSTEYAYQLKLPKAQLSSVNKDLFKAKEYIDNDDDSVILKMLEIEVLDTSGIEFNLME